MARWMINCEEHSRLTSESMDRSLSPWNRLSIMIHQWVCPPCKQLRKQFDAIRKACRRMPAESEKDREVEKATINMPEDVCQRMKSALRKHLK